MGVSVGLANLQTVLRSSLQHRCVSCHRGERIVPSTEPPIPRRPSERSMADRWKLRCYWPIPVAVALAGILVGVLCFLQCAKTQTKAEQEFNTSPQVQALKQIESAGGRFVPYPRQPPLGADSPSVRLLGFERAWYLEPVACIELEYFPIDKEIKALAHVPGVKSLGLSNDYRVTLFPKVAGISFKEMREFVDLQQLYLFDIRLRVEDVEDLAHHKGLQHLVALRDVIDDENLEAIGRLLNLKRLVISSGDKLSDRAIKTFRKRQPGCQIRMNPGIFRFPDWDMLGTYEE